ncbi:MAG: YjbH domain-containing protein [SAR86 cluster bacterium]|nr:YjbH domain-containing protein [SAR86 cluster bacterium]
MSEKKLWLITFSLVVFNSLSSSIIDYYPYKVLPGASNYGNTGIMEMPNARLMPEAQLRFNFSSSYPHEFTSITASPFSWLEATYRYTEIKNRKYGPSGYSGNQSLKDKGFDIKLLLREETFLLPAISIGLRDLAGTGIFSSEYFVSSKKFGKIDLSMGIGWGVLGSDDNINNPFESISEGFASREGDIGQGGKFSVKKWFSGRTSLFGGLEYDLPKRGLRLKLEYDTSNPDWNRLVPKVKSRLNLGLNYSFSENLSISSSYERGQQFRVSFNLTGNFLKDSIPKPKPKTVQRLNLDQKNRIKANADIFYRSLNLSLRDESIFIQAASLKDKEIDIAIASSRFYSLTRPVGRAARITAALAPDEIEKINIYSMNGDFEVAKFTLGKDYFQKADNGRFSPIELLDTSKINSIESRPLYERASFIPKVIFPEFDWSMSPAIRHQIGGPEGFYLGQLFWRTDTTLKLKRNLLLYSSFGISLYDTFNDLNNPSQSTIPKVRSDIQQYLLEGKNNIQRIQLEYFASPSKDVFTRLDIGLLEEMFGGIGGEVLYRPFKKQYSIGLSMHKVRQRGYEQLFSFREYSTVTGHLGIYYDLPKQIRSQLLIGKYLAGDKGATLDISKRFNSGFTLGIFATKTNLSAEEFGEGSFDKGFYISIPTQLFYSDFRSGNISFGLHPLTKDGGSILNKHNSLISILGDSSYSSITRDWDNILR